MEKSADLRDAMHLYYDEPIWGHMNEKELSQYLIPCISLMLYLNSFGFQLYEGC